MTTLTTPQVSPRSVSPSATMESPLRTPENRTLLHGVDWAAYLRFRNDERNDSLRMTYCSGRLEMMSPSRRHESVTWHIGRFVECWRDEWDIAYDPSGSTTLTAEELQKGLEPDTCYYIQNELAIRERDEIDLSIDPPPDLAVEVEVTSPLLSKLKIYAAIKVPEVWQWQNGRIRVLLLNDAGEYVESDDSRCLSGFPFEEMVRLIEQRHVLDKMSLLRQFREWIREFRKPQIPTKPEANPES